VLPELKYLVGARGGLLSEHGTETRLYSDLKRRAVDRFQGAIVPECPHCVAITRDLLGRLVPSTLRYEPNEKRDLGLGLRHDHQQFPPELTLKDMLALCIQGEDVLSLPYEEVGIEGLALSK